MRLVSYLKARIEERSTWAGISAAVIGGSALAAPFNWICVAAGIVAALVPSPPLKGAGGA